MVRPTSEGLYQHLLAVAAGVDTSSGWMLGARRVPSPNFDARPGGILPELIVVHGISLPPDDFGGPWIDRLFTNTLPPAEHPYFEKIKELRVSTHLLIRRDGELVQYVSLLDRAWHAGASCYQGRERCNDFSVGIELEGADEIPYEPAQYRILSATILELCRAYPSLSPSRIAGHNEIAPGRKTDPGPAFEWQRLYALLGAAG